MQRVLTAAVMFILTISLRWAWSEETGKSPYFNFTVSVYNDVGVPPAILHRAERQAGNIFARAGFEVVWVNCPQAEDALACDRIDEPGHLALRIIPDAAISLSDAAFGVAFLSPDGSGRYSDVFWKRAQDLHAISNLDLSGILGSVIAHEIGHLLLGSNAHAVSGIMRAHWEAEELRRIAMGTLLFTPQQAKLMHERARRPESAERKIAEQLEDETKQSLCCDLINPL